MTQMLVGVVGAMLSLSLLCWQLLGEAPNDRPFLQDAMGSTSPSHGEFPATGAGIVEIRPPPSPSSGGLAVWTVMLGDYDSMPNYNCTNVYQIGGPVQRRLNMTIDCFYITDSRNSTLIQSLAELGWTHINYTLPEGRSPKWGQRRLKVLMDFGENFSLDDYAFTVWHDSNMKINGATAASLGTALDQLRQNSSLQLLVPRHPTRTTVAGERWAVGQFRMCNARNLSRNKELLAEYPDLDGLSETCILVRRGRRSEAMRRGEQTWFAIMWASGCHRDQIAFEYAMWKEGVPVDRLRAKARPFERSAHLYNLKRLKRRR